MCGIAGVIGEALGKSISEQMLATMARRGPDGRGIYTAPECCLLHTRLAIIDPAGGKQPMVLSWGQDTFVITYNGELYNTEEIRTLLKLEGHSFQTKSDTEVLLHAFAQWGEECLQKLNGIYAFAVWSEREKRLFLARDRMGVKPLFYAEKNGLFVFASEMKTLLVHPRISPRVGSKGISQLILLGPGRIPGQTAFEEIYELLPGECGWYSAGKLIKKKYWMLSDHPHEDSFAQTAEKVRYLVLDAISRQMVSDVPIGTFLSGGLDSSIISAVCASQLKEKLQTFSVGYENNDRYFKAGKFQPDQDDGYIAIMQQHIGSDHRTTVLTPAQLVDNLEGATRARDLPGMADVDFSLLAFCADVKKHVKVALSGECADEMFGGYPWFRDKQVRDQAGFPWSQNTAYRKSFLNGAWSVREEMANDLYRDTVNSCDILPGTNVEDRRTKEMAVLNMYWFMQTLLDRKDRMSMYNGLEVRVPFCDHRIAEYLYSVPWSMKDHKGREKGLLRSAMEGLLPDRILWRKKSPYPKTHDPKYTSLVHQKLENLLADPNARVWDVVEKDKLRTLLTDEQPWPWYGQLMTGPQTVAYFLQLEYWLEHYKVTFV